MQLGAKGEAEKKNPMKCKHQHDASSWVSPEIPVPANDLHLLPSKESQRTPFLPCSARAARLGYLVTSDPKSPGTLEVVFRLPYKTGDFLSFCLRSNLCCQRRGSICYILRKTVDKAVKPTTQSWTASTVGSRAASICRNTLSKVSSHFL